MKTTRKMTIDFTIMIQVASAKLVSASGIKAFAISTYSAPLSRFAFSSAVPAIRKAAPGRIRSRSCDPGADARSVRPHLDLVAVGDPEPLGVGRRQLDLLLRDQEAKRRVALGRPRSPTDRGRSQAAARRSSPPNDETSDDERPAGRSTAAKLLAASRVCHRTPVPPISSGVSPA